MKDKNIVATCIFLWVNAVLFCSCGISAGLFHGSVKTKNNVIVVNNPEEPIYSRDIFQITKGLTIGDNEREPLFKSIRNIQVDDAGNIYVLDSGTLEVKIFNSAGRLIRRFGKKGQGPGEFQLPVIMQLWLNKEIVINDLGNVRIMFFSLEGKLIREVSRSRYFRMARIILDSKGNIIGEISRQTSKNISEIIKFTPDLQPIWRMTVKETDISPPDTINLLGPQVSCHIQKNDNIIWTNALDYKLNVLSPEGKTIKTIYRDYKPKEISEAVKKDLIESWIKVVGIAPEPGVKYIFPKYFPPIQYASIDDEDRIIVQTYEKSDPGFICIDIFDKDGKFIAKAAPDLFPWIIHKNKMYTVDENKEGFQIIKIYDIKWKM